MSFMKDEIVVYGSIYVESLNKGSLLAWFLVWFTSYSVINIWLHRSQRDLLQSWYAR